MTRHEGAAWSDLATRGRLHDAIRGPEWPRTLADAAARIAAREAAARIVDAALSTQPATRTRPQPPAAPQDAPTRPPKR